MELILAIITAVVNFGLVLAVLSKNSRSMLNRTFAGLIFVNSLYPIFNYFSLHSQGPELAFLWAKLAIFTGVCTGPLYFFFVDSFARTRFKYRRLFARGLSIWWVINSILLFTNLLFRSVTITNGQPQLTIGPAIPSFGLMMLFTLAGGSIRLIQMYRRSKGLEHAQLQLVATGLIAGFGLTLLATIILPLGFGITLFISISPIFLLAAGIIISYAIITRRLFDIRSLVARSAAYVLLLSTLACGYAVALYALSGLFFPTHTNQMSESLFNILLALVLSVTFQPLRRFFEKITNRVFYRHHYDSEEVISNFTKILVSELDLNRVLKQTITELSEKLHIQFGQLIIFNDNKVYRVEHYGLLPKRLMIAPELAKLDKGILIADELESGERKEIMDTHNIRVSMILRTRDEFIGYLLLGDKLSGGIYSGQDLELLEIIGKELAVAISNAKAYAEIQEFNLTLQARIDHATNRLRLANRHLKELDHAKDEFISMASHQLRTPLTTIKGYLSMMQEGDAGKLTKAQEEFVGYAFGSSERMVNLISDLLNVSRLSAGRFLIQTKPTDMAAMISDEVRQLQTHATAKNLKLIFEPPVKNLPLAEVDDNKTRQVIMNFIDNAIYYTKQGEVRVILKQSGDRIRLEVRDTGIGVPDSAKRKLFSKFFRADNAQIVRPDGTGLGLYLAKRVIEDQGGTIIFNSEEGKGSTFGFELPLKPVTAKKHEVVHAKNPKSKA